ncbi:MAG: hypothetical protein JXA30_21865 [Deltaproteobacteria bacterium]|nr:hypothetical protein [Deltaproteobacteria bacterium]
MVIPPPMKINAYADHKWVKTTCPAADTGSELDWLTFFWWVNNRGSNKYGYADFKNVYRQACTGGSGNCNSHEVPWNNLRNAVNTLYGGNSAKAIFWTNTGDTKGVNL